MALIHGIGRTRACAGSGSSMRTVPTGLSLPQAYTPRNRQKNIKLTIQAAYILLRSLPVSFMRCPITGHSPLSPISLISVHVTVLLTW